MIVIKRFLAALGVALLVMIGGATAAAAADRQSVDGPLSVGVIEGSVRVPEALRQGSSGTVSSLYGAPGAWAVTSPDPFTADPAQSGWGVHVEVYRVLPYDGSDLTSSDRQSVCRGEFVGGPEEFPNQDDGRLGAPAVPFPAIDLTTVPWVAEGYAEGYLIPSDEYTGDVSWNRNLDGLVWTPTEHMEQVDFVDTRVGSPLEWNASFNVVVQTYYTPGWNCGDDPFTPETGDPEPELEPTPEVTPAPEPEPTPDPPVVPDVPEPTPEEPVVPEVPEAPEVPELPEEPAAPVEPVEDEPEMAVPFAPSTGIEVDESSSSPLGWVLIGSGLSLGAAALFAARRWL